MQLKHRFKSVKDIGFVELLYCKQFHFYNFANNFRERSFHYLQEMYKLRFEFSRLRSELHVSYSRTDFCKNNIEELHRYMHENDLDGGFNPLGPGFIPFFAELCNPITHQAIELESYPNHPQIQKVL